MASGMQIKFYARSGLSMVVEIRRGKRRRLGDGFYSVGLCSILDKNCSLPFFRNERKI